MMKSGRTNKKKNRKRVYLQPGPDRRNVTRGVEWLRKMIEASEEKKSMDKVVDEMTKTGNEN